MAITIDYATKIISVPKLDMTLVQTNPVEIRSLNIDTFRQTLGALQANSAGIAFTKNHKHTAPVVLGGVTYARLVEVLAPYTITFENLLYNVNIVGGNSNIADRVNKNQVGVNTANSAGLQDPFSLQAAAFANEVTIRTTTSNTGTAFPVGTRGFPVNNLADALSIAIARGIGTFRVLGSLTLGAGDFSNGYTFLGDSPETATIVLQSAVNVTNCSFESCTMSGVLDGANEIVECVVGAITVFQGVILGSWIDGPVTLGLSSKSMLVGCHSNHPGSGPADIPEINFGGAVGADLLVRDWHGGLKLTNLTDPTVVASIDMSSGRVVVDSTITAGTITIRGIANVTDNSGVGATIADDTISCKVNRAEKLLASDQVFDKATGLLHFYERGTTIDIITPKNVIGESQAVDASIKQ